MERVVEEVDEVTVRSARFADLSPSALYGILRLRSEVFVVEQECVFLDADGRDTAPTAVHLWIEERAGGGDASTPVVIACARVLKEGEGSVLGRVVTAPAHRRRGIGERIVRDALAIAARPVVIDAQTQLVDWYRSFGFDVVGEEFVEDGIPHVRMVLE